MRMKAILFVLLSVLVLIGGCTKISAPASSGAAAYETADNGASEPASSQESAVPVSEAQPSKQTPTETKAPASQQSASKSTAQAPRQSQKSQQPSSTPAAEPAAVTASASESSASAPAATDITAPVPAAQASPSQEQSKPAVKMSIVGDKDKGTILQTSSVELAQGDTAFSVLQRVTKSQKIQMESRGRGAAAYVQGIDNLYEFDKGSKSGWLYRVNGAFPNVGAGAYKVKDGDVIEWLYTLDMGKDVGKAKE